MEQQTSESPVLELLGRDCGLDRGLEPRPEDADARADRVMPLTHRAKYTMLVQSTVALALFGLIVARSVNAFT
jgi:hypothetical protein